LRQNLDTKLWSSSTLFCGVDEVGRGALAGPVVAAAVVLRRHARLDGVRDSKLLTARRRERLDAVIRATALAWGVGSASQRTIDRDNILEATLAAMRRAVARLKLRPELVLVDGPAVPDVGLPCTGIVGGDNRSLSIACASIVAKVYRDSMMTRLDRLAPGYGFSRHKGYGTAGHLAALNRLGPSPIHRRSFAPVAALTRQ
jgi:ribonuclease HII